MIAKNRSGIRAALVLSLLIVLAGCAAAPWAAAPGSGAPPSSAVECLVAYSARAGTGIDREQTVLLSVETRQQELDLGDLTFHAQYWPPGASPGEHTFRVWVTDNDAQSEVVAQLYQLPLNAAVRNQFMGDHGFTGLSYVHHPVSRAELQFTCQAR
jgi:hypothetical protein